MKILQKHKIKKKLKELNDTSEVALEEKKNYSSSEDDEGLKEPTAEQIAQSAKPENIYSIQSVRAKQKVKHFKNVEQKKCKNKLQHKTILEKYLQTWKNDRLNWKYKKLLQIEIVSKMFDENIINIYLWPLVLEYLEGSEGMAKKKIIEKAQNEISNLDREIEEGKKELLESVKYSRARQIIQNLN